MKMRDLVWPAGVFLLTGVAGGAWVGAQGRGAGPGRDSGETAGRGGASLNPGAKPGPGVKSPAFREAMDFIRQLQSARLEDLPGLWASLLEAEGARPPGARASPKQMMIIQRWAELDPRGAVAFVMDGRKMSMLLSSIFAVWGAADPGAALAALKEEKDAEAQGAEATGWLQAVKDDPAALIARAGRLAWMDVSKLRREDFSREVPADFLEKLYAADPEGLKQLGDWMPPWFREMLAALEWRKNFRDHPAQALTDLETMPLTEGQLPEILSSLESLAQSQPDRVADLLLKLAERPGPPLLTENTWYEGGGKMLESLMKNLATRDPERLRGVLSKIGAQIAGATFVIDSLLQDHMKEALMIAPAFFKADLMGEMTSPPLPATDPAETLAMVREAPPSYYRDKLMERALLGMNKKDPAAAQAWIDALPEGEVRKSAQLTLDLADASPEMRMMERRGTTEGQGPMSKEEKETLTNATFRALADDLPEATRRITDWPPGPARDVALATAAEGAMKNGDARQTLDWAAALPEESQRAAAYAGIAKGWTASDPVAASEWVAALPSGGLRESAVGSFAAAIAEKDPEAGLQWAASLQNSGDRMQRLGEVVETWKTKDAAAAARAVQNLPGLAASERSQLLKSNP